MSKKNKVIKLGSKKRDRGQDYLVTFNGVQMTRIEREALLREQSKSNAPETVSKKAKKGTKVAEPRHSKLFNLLHPNKKQTVAPDLKSVEASAPVVKKAEPKKEEPKKEEPKKEEKKAEPVVEEEKKAAPAPAPIPTNVVTGDDDFVEEEDDGEEDDLSEELNIHNAKKRISPRFVLRVGKTSAKSCDEYINAEAGLDKKIAAVEAEIKKAKTPKDADEATRAQFNEKRKALRAEKKALELEKSTNASKAEALERAADGYCDIFKLLTGKVLQVRKTERINEYHPLTEEQELEVLNSLWADKSARKAPKKKA
ncbi:MAG: hypothetical protein J6P81_07855 [Spirochaetales bacterium]|nr:hypothetical protein [Spirochaetales bacterium]MBO6049634.1 hypothetical protein [Spirochaetales bacterium]MBP5757254.1 hypothetical protein [Spirochaetales bacterium]